VPPAEILEGDLYLVHEGKDSIKVTAFLRSFDGSKYTQDYYTHEYSLRSKGADFGFPTTHPRGTRAPQRVH
jgi:hypothetical protein